MRLWRVILLVNLALGVGLLCGYLAWGREATRLGQELERTRLGQAGAGSRRVEVLAAASRAPQF